MDGYYKHLNRSFICSECKVWATKTDAGWYDSSRAFVFCQLCYESISAEELRLLQVAKLKELTERHPENKIFLINFILDVIEDDNVAKRAAHFQNASNGDAASAQNPESQALTLYSLDALGEEGFANTLIWTHLVREAFEDGLDDGKAEVDVDGAPDEYASGEQASDEYASEIQ